VWLQLSQFLFQMMDKGMGRDQDSGSEEEEEEEGLVGRRCVRRHGVECVDPLHFPPSVTPPPPLSLAHARPGAHAHTSTPTETHPKNIVDVVCAVGTRFLMPPWGFGPEAGSVTWRLTLTTRAKGVVGR
jgi:hypothetical protein